MKLAQSQGLFNSKASFHRPGPNGQCRLCLGMSGNPMRRHSSLIFPEASNRQDSATGTAQRLWALSKPGRHTHVVCQRFAPIGPNLKDFPASQTRPGEPGTSRRDTEAGDRQLCHQAETRGPQAVLPRKLLFPHSRASWAQTGDLQGALGPAAISLGAGKRPATYPPSPVTESPEQPREGGRWQAAASCQP